MSLEALALEIRNDRHKDNGCGCMDEYGHGWRSHAYWDGERICGM